MLLKQVSKNIGTIVKRFWIVLFLISLYVAGVAQSLHPSKELNDSLPKLGIALSGGGAKGIAHIAVLEALDSLHIPVSYITGTSMGSVIGGLYAAGYSGKAIKKIAFTLDWNKLLSDKLSRNKEAIYVKPFSEIFPIILEKSNNKFHIPSGLVEGYNLLKELNHLFLPVMHIHHFDSLRIPFHCIGTNIESGNKKVFSNGVITDAIRASISIPSYFVPWKVDDSLYVDGGLVSNNPVEEAYAMGADIVLAVDISAPLKNRNNLQDALSILNQSVSIGMVKNSKAELKKATYVIRPNITHFGVLDFEKARAIYDSGKIAVQRNKTIFEQLAQLYSTKYVQQKSTRSAHIPSKDDSVSISYLKIYGDQTFRKETYLSLGLHHSGEKKIKDLENRLDLLYGTGRFKNLIMRIEKREDSTHTLYVKVVPRKKSMIGISYNLSNYYNLEWLINYFNPAFLQNKFNLMSSLLFGEKIIFTSQLFTSIYQQQKFSLGMGFLYNKESLPLYQNDQQIASYKKRNFSLGIFIRKFFRNTAMIQLSAMMEKFYAVPEVGNLDFQKDSDLFFTLSARTYIDQLDNGYLPTTGYFLLAHYTQIYSRWTNYKYNIFHLKWSVYSNVKNEATFFLKFHFGTSFHSPDYLANRFFLGGPDNFYAAHFHQFSVPHYYLLDTGFRYPFQRVHHFLMGIQYFKGVMSQAEFNFKGISSGYIQYRHPGRIGNITITLASSQKSLFTGWVSVGFPIFTLQQYMH